MLGKSWMVAGMVLILITSCEQSSPEEDIEAYCECVTENGGSKTCAQMAEEMITKYEYDQEAAEMIVEKIANCGSE